MSDRRKRTDRITKAKPASERQSETPGPDVADDPAVERGERIATGKQIARGGKTTGDVPGTQEREDQKP